MVEIISRSEAETKAIAKNLAGKLPAGSVLALIGPLGGGKTAFVKGLAQGLGLKNKIASPTFVIYQVYPVPGRKKQKFYHFDLYRLDHAKQLGELGLAEILQNPKNILAIEWAEKINKLLPPRTIYIRFRRGKTPNARKIIFS